MRSPQRAIQPRQTPDFRQAPLGTRIWKHRSIYLFILPAFVWFLVFCYYPMYGLLLAFKDYKYSKGILGSAWVGLKWFRKFMADPSFWQVVMNTLKYNVSRITVQRALSELKLQGVITRKPRAGTFVLSPAPKPVFSPEKSSDRINIGVVAPFGMESPGIYQYLDGILSALSVPRDNLSLHNTCYVEAYDRTMLENCLKDNCSGIIYYPGLSSAPPLDLLTQMSVEGYPCVLIDKRVPGIELPCVQSNNVLGERAVVEHLIELGHRSIVFAAGSYTMSVYERYEGFCRTMHDAGLGRLDRMYCSLTALEDDRSAMVEQVRAWIHSGVTAVCCSADSHAKRLADLCGEIHVDIPRQLAISGFDGVYRGSITSVLQPYARIGRVATETLLKWILTGDVNREVVEMDAQFLLGASTLPNDEAADAQST